ncbi:MAG TPA: dihydropteroate synthase [bacterium]|jgi:dihydropteroate synthase
MEAEATTARVWEYRGGEFLLGKRTLLMGIVNVTPDSFSDGGRFFDAQSAADHALQLIQDGADLLDLGAESTRPGSDAVDADEQLRRLIPVFEKLRGKVTVPLSVDTTYAKVAAECLQAGASIVNDVSGFHGDVELPEVCAAQNAGVVLMHMRGMPKVMQQDTQYGDLFGEIEDYLADGVRIALQAGIPRSRILVDPGIGFGKTFEQNYRLLGGLDGFRTLAAGVLAGPSRKAFTGEFNHLPPDQRQYSTAAAVAIAALYGADVVRVHDVREIKQVVDILDRFREIHGQLKA